MPSRLLYVHIGLQKTGTSYLQSIFWHNQAEVARQGLDMVPGSKRETFHLMLRARDRYRAEFDPPEVATALDRFPDQLRSASAPRALVTEESLAAGTSDQIAALLGAAADREVHLVVTARDLARQIPSAWQQMIQSGSDVGYQRYLKKLQAQQGEADPPLWRNKNLPAILARWHEFVPAERIHVVTLPRSGAAKTELLERYCSVVGVDHTTLDLGVTTVNESLGRVQAEVLRRVNAALDKDFRRRDVYGDIGKRAFAMGVLAPQRGERIMLPAAYADWCREVSQTYIDAISAAGYQVVGALDELLPDPVSYSQGKVAAGDDEVAEAATAALATMLTRDMNRLRKRRAEDRGPGKTTRKALSRLLSKG